MLSAAVSLMHLPLSHLHFISYCPNIWNILLWKSEINCFAILEISPSFSALANTIHCLRLTKWLPNKLCLKNTKKESTVCLTVLVQQHDIDFSKQTVIFTVGLPKQQKNLHLHEIRYFQYITSICSNTQQFWKGSEIVSNRKG